jgi:DNA-binding NtrC family response regulator
MATTKTERGPVLRLTTEERDFFELVSQAVLANPFSDARAQIDARIAGLYADDSGLESVDRVIEQVEQRVMLLDAEKRSDIKRYNDRDRRLLTYAFLFEAFHRFSPRFDELIAAQIADGERSLPVAFAAEMIARLEGRGFAHTEAVRYFELGFQLRRAYFFIHQSLIGRSPCMRLLREKLWNNVFTHNIDWYDRFLWNRMEDFSTLILGPTGAGKGTAAGAIGRSAYIPFDEHKGCFVTSFAGSFLALNLSQFSETLIESELFGHRKGAFTGAREDYKGVFSRCNPYGAIFLDEIGEVSQPIQIKLLHVLQERRFTPVGSHEVQRFSGRIIAATNRPLAELRSHGILRDDFYYRLCSDVIAIPSLAERIGEDPAELDDLLDHTVACILGKPSSQLTDMLRDTITSRLGTGYAWPGNVRELEQCVRRILLNRTYDPSDPAPPADPDARLAADILEGNLDAQGLLAAYCHALHRRLGTIEAVARQVGLDRRTVKKHIEAGRAHWVG